MQSRVDGDAGMMAARFALVSPAAVPGFVADPSALPCAAAVPVVMGGAASPSCAAITTAMPNAIFSGLRNMLAALNRFCGGQHERCAPSIHKAASLIRQECLLL